jgi:hypothetical protein
VAEAALAGVHRRERENSQGEKRKEGEGRGAHGIVLRLQGVFSVAWAASRRWPTTSRGKPHSCFGRRPRGVLQIAPWALGFFFLEQNKQHPFVLFGDSNYSKVFK